MNVVSAVANLVKELDYYKDLASEAQDVIKQLSEGPDDIEFIHPLDTLELFENNVVVDVYEEKFKAPSGNKVQLISVGGKKYRQSILMPKKTKTVL